MRIVGETPNLAARLQSLAEPNSGGDRADARAASSAGCSTTATSARVTLKGFAEPVQAWQVAGPERRGEPLRRPA